jgi:hypothetical protein
MKTSLVLGTIAVVIFLQAGLLQALSEGPAEADRISRI